MVKLPEPPPVEALRRIPPELESLPAGTRLYHIYFRGGRHPGGWGRFRHFGPLEGARFDHHTDPARVQERGIFYAAVGSDAIATTIAEVFQDKRLVDTGHRQPRLACFSLTHSLELLNLRDKWPTYVGASANINSGPRPRCRRWSAMIYEAYPEVCGLLYASSMNGGRPAVALYERGGHALPLAPILNMALSDGALLPPLSRIVSSLGYELV